MPVSRERAFMNAATTGKSGWRPSIETSNRPQARPDCESVDEAVRRVPEPEHGPDTEHLYGGSYSDDDLRWWADRIREWEAQGRETFAYFNNDWEGNAVRNAETLVAFLNS